MALLAIMDKLDGLSDDIKSHYVEKDGKFILGVTPVDGFELDDVSGLKNSLSAARGESTGAAKELGKYGVKWDATKKAWEHTYDPSKVKEAVGKYDEFMTLDPAKEADKIAQTKIESAKSQLMTQHAAELEGKDKRLGKLETVIQKTLRTNTAKAAIIAAKGDPELLLPHVERFIRIKETDDDFDIEIIDDKGNVRIGDAKGNPMTVDQLIADMRKSPTYGKAFEGDGKTGTGKVPNSGGGNLPLKRSEMTAKQKADYVTEHGQQEFLKLPR